MATPVKKIRLAPDGPFPNNPRRPLLIYPQAVAPSGNDPAAVFEDRFGAHAWVHAWRNGVFAFHHYHSMAHEVLGVYRGMARIRCGGPQGMTAEVRAGDVVVIPAEVAHQRISSSVDFAAVGAYPRGQTPDLHRGQPGERPGTDANIRPVTRPPADPVHGTSGGLMNGWPA